MHTDKSLTKRQRRELRKQEKVQAQAKIKQKRTMMRWTVWIIIFLVIGGGTYFVFAATDRQADQLSGGDIDNPVYGSTDAQIVITEYSDFSCPACAVGAPIAKQVIDKYKGQVALEFNGFDLRHTWSNQSLQAGECAYQQGNDAFWNMHDLLFANQTAWVQADDVLDQFILFAGEAGLDTAQLTACLENGKTSAAVATDTAAARSAQINSTPTFMIDDEKLVGVQSVEDFSLIIDRKLKTNSAATETAE